MTLEIGDLLPLPYDVWRRESAEWETDYGILERMKLRLTQLELKWKVAPACTVVIRSTDLSVRRSGVVYLLKCKSAEMNGMEMVLASRSAAIALIVHLFKGGPASCLGIVILFNLFQQPNPSVGSSFIVTME